MKLKKLIGIVVGLLFAVILIGGIAGIALYTKV